ncbi:1-phosphofructokinase family hexose kinase [Mycobacterium sp. PSTR-4-N]|uniref:1-phosphofructokinase family hexose kinase n=1 Tax=Mycobacterium sp. PSTR-4-N TaxID=2917745 RepID=UPI001F14A050|nr:1-phosphofructokinase family hexose kinase [Mycobacterium sp. PSTR-4-N]MCG7592616.1 1-phosphofructokinase family hexose kinase [Mycobacterium sp. PSTR-4-N]
MSGSRVVTLTMNSALDVAVDADTVRPTDKVRCRAARYDAGGGGINVARFAHVLGADVAAIFTAGGFTGARIVDIVEATGVAATPVPILGATRESFTVNEGATGAQYRFVLPGPFLTPDEQILCLNAVRDAATSADYVVASGSLPPGVAPDFYQRVSDICAETDAALILDTSGGGLAHVSSGVHLLKPSLRELRECVGRSLDTEAEQRAAARELVDRGLADAVVVSLGAEGALLVTPHLTERFPAVEVLSVSGVGAGDAMVAGIVVGLARCWDLPAAVRFGIAAAAAKLQTPGTSEFSADEVEKIYSLVTAGRSGQPARTHRPVPQSHR